MLLDPVLLALSNGYVQTIFACHASGLVARKDTQDGYSVALGNLIAIAITSGISVGGIIQIPFASALP